MNKKKKRFHYYEDQDVYDYIKKLRPWTQAQWVRDATRTRFELSTVSRKKH